MGARGRTIINDILPVLEAADGRPLTADAIAKKMKEDPDRVRNSLQNFSRTYPSGPVERITTGIFRWREEHVTPTTGAPVIHTVADESDLVAYETVPATPAGRSTVTQEFDVVMRKENILVLLDETGDIWVAKRVQER